MRILLSFLFLLALTLPTMAQDYQADYKAIEAQEREGKYRTARDLAEALYDKADAAGDQDDMLKALILVAGYGYQLEEDGNQAKLDRFREELAEQSGRPVITPLLHYLIGTTYLDYADQNRWRLRNNTAVAGEGLPADTLPLEEWNLVQLQRAGFEQLTRALELAADNRTPLQRLPAVVTFDEARLPERPTLYDVLAADVLPRLSNDFNSVGDERPTEPDELLAPVPDFLRLDLDTRLDPTKSTYRKLKLYQDWLAYNSGGGGRPSPALAAADLERLQYVARLGAADSTYAAALERAATTYAALPLADRFTLARAELTASSADIGGERPRVEALRLLDRIGDRDPLAAAGAYNLRQSITRPELNVTLREAYPTQQPHLFSVAYQNIERVFVRVYPVDLVAEEDRRGDENPKQRLARLSAGSPVATADFRPRANDDYEQHLTEYYLDALPAGAYYLLLSTGTDFDPDRDALAESFFQVSDLALVQYEDERNYRGLVTDRTTGESLAGVTVVLERRARYGSRRSYDPVATLTTDNAGTFAFPEGRDNGYRVRLQQGGKDRLVTQLYAYRSGDRREKPRQYTNLLTDRGLYRPGQTVHVYGLQLRKEDGDALPTIVTNQSVTVTLLDANRQEVAQREVTTDRYGRFSTDFVLPASGLTGTFLLRTENGSQSVRVEEYKRPRFFIEMDETDPVLPGATTEVTGTVNAFAGPPLAGAEVRYRIFLEEVRYYRSFYFGGGGGERELLDSGTTKTENDGGFTVPVTARATLANRGWRSYRYVVEVDVTDDTGETHTASTGVGVRGLQPVVNLTADDLVNRGDSLTISASSARGDTTFAVQLTIVPVTKPDAAPRERSWPIPDRPVLDRATFRRLFPDLSYAPTPALADWPRDDRHEMTGSGTVTLTEGNGQLTLPVTLPVGHYRVEFRNPDGSAGAPITFAVFDGETGALPAGVAHHLYRSTEGDAPGEFMNFTLLTAQRLPLVVTSRGSRAGRVVGRTTVADRQTFTYRIQEADRPTLVFRAFFVRANGLHQFSETTNIGWDNKQLQFTYGTFRDKLLPGQPERWTVTVSTADSSPVPAAALATMYDKSLDELGGGGGWSLLGFPSYYGGGQFSNGSLFGTNSGYLQRYYEEEGRSFEIPALPELDLGIGYGSGRFRESMMMRSAPRPAALEMVQEESEVRTTSAADAAYDSNEKIQNYSAVTGGEAPPPPPPPPAPGQGNDAPVQIRTKLQETAFWLPELTADADGNLVIAFESPEALTSWNFRLFAHDTDFNYHIDSRTVKTQKDLMVLPNAPRFLREGDRMDLTSKVSNLTERPMTAEVTVEFFDPATNRYPDWLLGEDAGAKPLKVGDVVVPAGGSETVAFTLDIPDGASSAGTLGYRVIARAPGFSDGEENVLPILTDRTLVTATKPFYVRRGQEKTINVPGLAQRAGQSASATARPVAYTFQATTNPAWLALKSLPYLMEYPYDCTEQLANRFFANQLAYATIRNKPVLETVFRRWEADSNALKSELERNSTLRNALLTETPWVRAAQDEAEQRARIGQLFDLQRLAGEQADALDKLAFRQQPDGGYSWFPDGRTNAYITQYVVETFTRMRELGALDGNQRQRVEEISERATAFLDRHYAERYDRLRKDKQFKPQKYVPTAAEVHYLYATSGQPLSTAAAFFLDRATASWTEQTLYGQALIALTAAARDRQPVATAILTSLRERALRADEFGMYWKYGRGYQWQTLPIETHCRILEAFRRIGGTTEEIDEMRLWLLSNKRTNRWETTKSTAAAVYALLNAGTNWTETDGRPVGVTFPAARSDDFASRVLAQMNSAEAATGSFSVQFTGEEINAGLGRVRVDNPDNELVWGGVFYQYTEVASRVTANNDGPLTLERSLFRRVPTADGMRLEPLADGAELSPGDRVTVRLIVRSDRSLDFVHLKDRRAATFEPVETTSRYAYKSGLGYYFAPGDLATNFFIDHLPKGTYTLEYDLFATYRGNFSNGLGRVQCMYAPEFGANTSGGRLVVQ